MMMILRHRPVDWVYSDDFFFAKNMLVVMSRSMQLPEGGIEEVKHLMGREGFSLKVFCLKLLL